MKGVSYYFYDPDNNLVEYWWPDESLKGRGHENPHPLAPSRGSSSADAEPDAANPSAARKGRGNGSYGAFQRTVPSGARSVMKPPEVLLVYMPTSLPSMSRTQTWPRFAASAASQATSVPEEL